MTAINDTRTSYDTFVFEKDDYYAEQLEVDMSNINPGHYKQGNVECIDAMESAVVNKKGIEAICVGNVIKYLWRYESKNGLEDVKKAQWYLNKLINTLED